MYFVIPVPGCRVPGSGFRDPGSEFTFPNSFLWDKRYTDTTAHSRLPVFAVFPVPGSLLPVFKFRPGSQGLSQVTLALAGHMTLDWRTLAKFRQVLITIN